MEPLDAVCLDRLRNMQQPGQPSVISRLLDAYLDSSSPLVETLHQALNEGDQQAAVAAAHSLKSSSATVGASQFSALCQQIEHLARSDKLVEAGQCKETLAVLYTRTCLLLRELKEDEG